MCEEFQLNKEKESFLLKEILNALGQTYLLFLYSHIATFDISLKKLRNLKHKVWTIFWEINSFFLNLRLSIINLFMYWHIIWR